VWDSNILSEVPNRQYLTCSHETAAGMGISEFDIWEKGMGREKGEEERRDEGNRERERTSNPTLFLRMQSSDIH